jgi:hypothetical protein
MQFNMLEVSVSCELTLGGVWLLAIYHKEYPIIIILGIYLFLCIAHSCIPSRLVDWLQCDYDELIEVQSEIPHVFDESSSTPTPDEQARLEKINQSFPQLVQRVNRLRGDAILLWRPWQQAFGLVNGRSLAIILCTYQVRKLCMEIKHLLHGLHSRTSVAQTPEGA